LGYKSESCWTVEGFVIGKYHNPLTLEISCRFSKIDPLQLLQNTNLFSAFPDYCSHVFFPSNHWSGYYFIISVYILLIRFHSEYV
jgi:hypothetical protein